MLRQQPQVTYILLDSSESSSMMRFNARHSTPAADAMTGAANLRTKIQPLTGARFTQQNVIYSAVEPEPGEPLADSDNSRVAVFVFSCAGDSQYAIIEVPGIRDDFIDTENPAHGMWISLTNPVVTAFVDYMISGTFVNRFGHALASLEAAFVQIRS